MRERAEGLSGIVFCNLCRNPSVFNLRGHVATRHYAGRVQEAIRFLEKCQAKNIIQMVTLSDEGKMKRAGWRPSFFPGRGSLWATRRWQVGGSPRLWSRGGMDGSFRAHPPVLFFVYSRYNGGVCESHNKPATF